MSAKVWGCWEHAPSDALSRGAGWPAIRLIVPPSSGPRDKCFPLALYAGLAPKIQVEISVRLSD